MKFSENRENATENLCAKLNARGRTAAHEKRKKKKKREKKALSMSKCHTAVYGNAFQCPEITIRYTNYIYSGNRGHVMRRKLNISGRIRSVAWND